MYLIDTNVLLFSLDHIEKLSAKAKDILQTEENFTIVTSDSIMPKYPVKTVW